MSKCTSKCKADIAIRGACHRYCHNQRCAKSAEIIPNPFHNRGFVVKVGENRYIADGHSSYAEYSSPDAARADAESLGYEVR